jgi:methyl-accepting chemotaxis protein
MIAYYYWKNLIFHITQASLETNIMATKTQGLRIRTKLLAMVLLLVFISIAVGAFSFYGLSQSVEKYQAQLLPVLEATHNLESTVAKARLLEKEFFLYSSLGKKAELKQKQSGLHQQMLATFERIPGQLKGLSTGQYNEYSSQSVRSELANNIRLSYNGAMNTLRPLSNALLEGKSYLEVSELYTGYQASVLGLEVSISKMRTHLSQALEAQKAAAVTFEADMIGFMLALGCGVIVFGVVIGIIVSGRVTRPLNQLMEGIESFGQGEFKEISINSRDEFEEIAKAFNSSLERIKSFLKSDEERQATEENVINFLEVVSEASDGDLTLRAPVTEDAFGTIADSYNLMIESLAALLTDASINAEEVGEESRQLLDIFQTIKDGADSQMQHVASATDAAENTADAAAQVAEKAALAQRAATSVDEATTLGNERVNRNIEGMQLIRVTVQVINKKMKSLAERLLEIGTISQLISDVATRTTILAMNASIEASRAGEQGRGFLVISDEIKRLADEASEATRQIGGIIKAIQSEANEVTLALEEETSTVEEQTKIAQETGEALAAINAATSESKQVVTEITKLSQEQQKISDDMVATIRKMADITADTSAMITTSSQISEGLNGVSESLLQSLGQFRLSAEEEPEAIDVSNQPQEMIAESYIESEEESEFEQEVQIS